MTIPPLQAACGYVRGSTDEQQDTLTAQSQQIAAYCQFKSLELCHPETRGATFIDSGTSAFSVPFYEREVAADMVAWMVAQKVRHLVFTKLDRGFRNTLDCLFTLRDLAAKGITVHILDLSLDTSTPVGKFVLTVMAAMAELENERRSERQKDVFKVRKAAGQICGNIPYGWRLAEKSEAAGGDGQLAPDLYEQAILARLTTGDLAACSANEAARRLNAAGTPAKKGGAWFGAAIGKIRQAAAVT